MNIDGEKLAAALKGDGSVGNDKDTIYYHVTDYLKKKSWWGQGTYTGIVMIAERFANDKLKDNLNPVCRLFYASSTMVCVPAWSSQNGPALGAQAGEGNLCI